MCVVRMLIYYELYMAYLLNTYYQFMSYLSLYVCFNAVLYKM